MYRIIVASDHTHFVWFLWTRDWPITETLTWQHSIHKRQISMHPAWFEPTIPTSEWPQAHALDCPDTGISLRLSWEAQLYILWCHIVFSFNFILFSSFTILVWNQPHETAETTTGDYKLLTTWKTEALISQWWHKEVCSLKRSIGLVADLKVWGLCVL